MSAASVLQRNGLEQGFANLLKTSNNDALMLSEREQSVLTLWDQLEELRLEISLLEAQASSQSAVPDASGEEVEAQVRMAERAALEARATYILQNRIVENALMTDPILKAVHAGANANIVERRLMPLVNERDVTSMVHTTVASQLASTTKSLSAAEQSYIITNKNNQHLAETLMTLVGDTTAPRPDEVQDSELRLQLEALKDQARAAKRKWRTVKGVVSGIVVGSGINWAQDEALTNLVLDDEDELE